jgi:hypothetical protein
VKHDIDLARLLELAKQGEAPVADTDRVAALLADDRHGMESYRQLFVVGLAGLDRHRELVESYFVDTTDAEKSALALRTACRTRRDALRYRSVIEQFLAKHAWDELGRARSSAIGCAGELLRVDESPVLLEALLKIFDDETEEKEERRHAYTALCRAMGKDWRDIPSTNVGRDPDVLTSARRRLSGH